MEGEWVNIYVLLDDAESPFYVGQTTGPIEGRRDEHYNRCQWESTATALRIRELRLRDIKPPVRLLERVAPGQANDREDWHIEDHLARGYVLTNKRYPQRARPARSASDAVAVLVLLPPEIAAALKARAKDEATPVSVLVRRWIVEELRRGQGRG